MVVASGLPGPRAMPVEGLLGRNRAQTGGALLNPQPARTGPSRPSAASKLTTPVTQAQRMQHKPRRYNTSLTNTRHGHESLNIHFLYQLLLQLIWKLLDSFFFALLVQYGFSELFSLLKQTYFQLVFNKIDIFIHDWITYKLPNDLSTNLLFIF